MSEEANDLFAPHVRWNFTVMGLDIALFVGGINFSAWSTILPLFIRHLTSSNVVLGMMPAVRNLGSTLPPVLVSAYVERLSRYKLYVLLWTTLERLPFLWLALASLAFGTSHPTLLLLIFFFSLATWSIAAGVTTPAWLHLVSLMIPTRLRGRFFGLSTGIGGLLGVGVAALTAVILRSYAFPLNFAVCFLATFVFLVGSFIALALGHEPVAPASQVKGMRVPLGTYLRSLPAFLRRERDFALFLLASVLANLCMAISPFVTVAASRTLHVSDPQVGVYGVVLLAISTVGSVGWGWLGDHAGYRPVLVGGSVAGLGSMLLALLALARHDAALFYGVYALMGAYNSATQLASFTAVIEFGDEADRPTFIALSSLVLAPVSLGAPVIGGILADRFGYSLIFAAAGIALVAAIFLYVFAVRDPRRQRTG